MVSAGNTGATMGAALLRMGRISGVARPAIATPLPRPSGGHPTVLLDAGANADCQAAWLVQFAQMGAVFARQRFGVEHPKVAALSIGEEKSKGNELVKEAHALLAADGGAALAAAGATFVGNVEGRDLLTDAADVVVCDGFTGNMALKVLEGTIRTVLDALREEIVASRRGKVGGLLIRPAARGLRRRLDPDTYGGAYLLGLRGLAVIAHGNSSRTAIANAIALGARGVTGNVVERLASRLAERTAVPH